MSMNCNVVTFQYPGFNKKTDLKHLKAIQKTITSTHFLPRIKYRINSLFRAVENIFITIFEYWFIDYI